MALNEVVTSWLALPITPFDFVKRGISESDYFLLLEQAALRAKNYILNTLQIPQSVLDLVDSANCDEFQIAYQFLSCYELLRLNTALFADILPYDNYSSPEGESVSQSNESFNRYLNTPYIFKNKAEAILKKYIPASPTELIPRTFNWC